MGEDLSEGTPAQRSELASQSINPVLTQTPKSKTAAPQEFFSNCGLELDNNAQVQEAFLPAMSIARRDMSSADSGCIRQFPSSFRIPPNNASIGSVVRVDK